MNYLCNAFHIEKKDVLNLFILVMIISGILGFFYEEIFYYIDLGYLVKRGSTFGPWIPIYVFGGLFITLLTIRFRERPFIVFLLSLFITGLLEYGTGFVLLHFFHIRLWDYNTEIWNFGNIHGFICFRSVLLFGLSGLFIIYVLIPFLLKVIHKFHSKYFTFFCWSLIILFTLDVIFYPVCKIFL